MIKLPFKFKKREDPSKFLTVDIGSNSVKVLAFEIEETEKGPISAIIGIGKQELLENSTRGGVIIDAEDVSKALNIAVSNACNGDEKISSAVFGVSGDLCFGLMTTVKIVRGKDKPITQKEVDSIFEKIYAAAHEQVQNVILETTGVQDTEMQLVTSAVIYSKLDGKLVNELIGQEGQKTEIAVFTAFTPEYHLNTLQDLADKNNLNIIAVGSTMHSMAKSLSFSKGRSFDGVLMDVGGEITDIGVIFGGGILATKSIPIGGTHFTQELSKSLNLSFKDAEHKKLEYSYGRLSDSENILMKGYLDNLLDIWLSGIELVFQEFSGVKTFAPNIYMVGGGAELPDIYDVTSKEPWTKSIPFKSPPEFSKLSIEDFPLIVDKTGKAHAMEDIGAATLSLVYLETIGKVE